MSVVIWKIKRIKESSLPPEYQTLFSEIQNTFLLLNYKIHYFDQKGFQIVLKQKDLKCTVEINLKKNRVITTIPHPRSSVSRTQLVRENCDLYDIKAILINPRSHTNKGKRLKQTKKKKVKYES